MAASTKANNCTDPRYMCLAVGAYGPTWFDLQSWHLDGAEKPLLRTSGESRSTLFRRDGRAREFMRDSWVLKSGDDDEEVAGLARLHEAASRVTRLLRGSRLPSTRHALVMCTSPLFKVFLRRRLFTVIIVADTIAEREIVNLGSSNGCCERSGALLVGERDGEESQR